MFDGMDFGFCGPSYTAADPLQDQQEAINWFLELDPQEHAKERIAMLGAPGLKSLMSTQTGPVRGCWVLPGGQQALAVTGNTAYLVTITVPATQNALPQFSVASVGTLLTNSGPVCIRDNGVLVNGLGGYAIIVDGIYAYYYLLSGTTYSNTFTGGVNGTATITLPGTLPNGLIVASTPTLSDAAGYIPNGTTVTAVDTVGLTITMSAVATGTNASEAITLTIPPFGRITDAGFLGANRIIFIEGWLGFERPGTRTIYTTGPTPYQVLFPGAFYALKDSSTDNVVTHHENHREWWVIGERTSEVWYNAGGVNFAFSRLPGVGPQIGCAAFGSITRMGDALIWLGRNEQGENILVTTNQYSWERVSNHGFEHAITQYPVVSDAIGYAYEEEGHVFYMITFPTADVTWAYDIATKQFHKRLSWDSGAAVFHRHRSNCYMNFGDVRMVGDYQTGQLHAMSRKYFTDNDGVIRMLRRTPHIWQKESRGRVFFSSLQVEFTPGVGLNNGQGINPQAMLRYSDDGGFTWSSEMWVSIGAIGDTINRAIWYLLGQCRDRIWEVSMTDPVQRDVIGATAFMEAGAA